MTRADFGYAPRGLSREEAARYIGVGVTLFDEMVADGRMPKPKRANSRTLWDRFALDAGEGRRQSRLAAYWAMTTWITSNFTVGTRSRNGWRWTACPYC